MTSEGRERGAPGGAAVTGRVLPPTWCDEHDCRVSECREHHRDQREVVGRVSSYDEYLQTYRPDEWERLRRERLTPEQIAYEDVTAAIRAAAKAVSEDACRHCGALPEADGDHSCPCPHSDESCPDHPLIAPARVLTGGSGTESGSASSPNAPYRLSDNRRLDDMQGHCCFAGCTLTTCNRCGAQSCVRGFHTCPQPEAVMEPLTGKVYLASRYSRHDEMQGVRDVLEALCGVFVTSRWIDLHAGTAPVSRTAEQLHEDTEGSAVYARHDMEDLFEAQTVISFTDGSNSSKGGRHVEFGAALALGKRLILVGPRENVFHTLPEVEWFPNWSRLVMAISGGLTPTTAKAAAQNAHSEREG